MRGENWIVSALVERYGQRSLATARVRTIVISSDPVIDEVNVQNINSFIMDHDYITILKIHQASSRKKL